MSDDKAGLMWSTHEREDRKTHVFIDADGLVCKSCVRALKARTR